MKDTDASAAPATITPTSLEFAGYPTVTGVKAEESKPADPKVEDKKSDAKSENTAEAKDQASQSDSKPDAKTGAQDSKSDSNSDSKPAPDAVKADKSGSAVKNGGSSVAKSDAGSSQAGSSRGALANTGANAVLPLVAFASVALIAGAALVMRRRKA